MKKLPKLNSKNIAFAILILIFLVLALRHIRSPLIMDEIEYPLVGKAISENLSASYYRGEMNPENLGLWHPPLYIVLLGTYFFLVPFLTSTARLFGVLIYVLTLVIFYVWFKKKIGEPNLVVFFLSFLPFFTFSSLLPDIDTQLFPLVAVISLISLETKFAWIGIAGSFLSKLTFGPIITFSYLLANSGEILKRNFRPVLNVLVGLAVFGVLWVFLNKLLGGSYQSNLDYIRASTNRPELTLTYLKSVFLENLQRNLLWINPLLIIAAALAFIRNKYQIFSLSAAFILLFLYTFVFRSYPFEFIKYLPVTLFFFLFSITFYLHKYQKIYPQIYVYFSVTFLISLFLGLIFINSDPLFSAYYVKGFKSAILTYYLHPVFLLLVVAPLFFLKNKRLYAVVGLLALVASIGLTTNLRSDTQKSVTYYYGEQNMNPLINYIKTNKIGTVISPKDVGFNAKIRYIELAQDTLSDEKTLKEVANKYKATHLVTRTNDYYAVKNWPVSNSKILKKEATINNFEIYKIQN